MRRFAAGVLSYWSWLDLQMAGILEDFKHEIKGS